MLTKNYLLNFEEYLKGTYCVTDIETTGQKPEDSEIIEIASVKVQNCKITDEYCSYVKPNNLVPSFITDMTGIKNEDVENAPGINSVLTEWVDFIKGSDFFCAHNVMFDYDFIYKYLKTLNLPMAGLDSLTFFCTVKTTRILFPDLKSRKLGDLITHFNIQTEKRHRALEDAKATAKILLICLEEIKKRKQELLDYIESAQTDKLKSFEAAEYLSMPKDRLYELVNSGTLKVSETYKTKNGYEGYLFLRKDLENLLTKQNYK